MFDTPNVGLRLTTLHAILIPLVYALKVHVIMLALSAVYYLVATSFECTPISTLMLQSGCGATLCY
jgi:hypothetical protein